MSRKYWPNEWRLQRVSGDTSVLTRRSGWEISDSRKIAQIFQY